jgi:hypothetical protein
MFEVNGRGIPVSAEPPNYIWEQEFSGQDFSQDTEDLSGQGVTDPEIFGQGILDQHILSLDVFNNNGLHQDFLDPMALYQDGFNLETDQNPLNLEDFDAFDANHVCDNNIVGPDLVDQRASGQSMVTQNVINQIFNLNQAITNRDIPGQHFNGTVNLDNANNDSLTAVLNPLPVLDDSEPRNTQDSFLDKSNRAKGGKSKISDKEWEDHKGVINQIWIVENHTMPELTRIMTRDYKFPAT